MKSRKLLVSLTACAAIVATGVLVTTLLGATRAGEDSTGVQATVAEKLPNVAVQSVTLRDVHDYLELTASVTPWEELTLSAETRGRIESQPIEEGDRVQHGQQLVLINTITIRANMDQAAAEFKMAEQDLARIEGLRESGISSPQELDQAVSKRDAARARLTLSQIQLDQSVITSKIDAVVDKLEKEEGEFADIGAPLVHLVQIDRVKILVGIPERDVAHFTLGDPVSVTFDAHPGREFTGTIYRIATTAEDTTRTFATEVEVDNRDRLLKPGMIARVRMVRNTFSNAVTVPLFAVVPREGRSVVFVEQNGVARMRPVTVGFVQNDYALLTNGLDQGDLLIISGQRDLQDGDRVAVPQPAAPAVADK